MAKLALADCLCYMIRTHAMAQTWRYEMPVICVSYIKFDKNSFTKIDYPAVYNYIADNTSVEVTQKFYDKFVNDSIFCLVNNCNIPEDIIYYFLYKSFHITDPVYSDSEDLITFFDGVAHKRENRRTKIKPGKFFKKIGPWLEDWQVEVLVEKLRKFFAETKNIFLKKGDNSEDFRFANLGSNYFKKESNSKYKSLNTSCMRYDFVNLPAHPSEVYASGDFEVWYTVDSDNKVHSRVVVSKKEQIYTDIYAVSQVSGDMLRSKLDSLKYSSDDYFENHKFLKVKHKGDFIAPYLDFNQTVDELDDKYFITSHSGTWLFDNTNGYASKCCKTCWECGEELCDYDYQDDNGNTYCWDCTITSDFSGDIASINNQDVEKVLVTGGWRGTWFDYEAHENACYTEDSGWAVPELCGETVDGDFYTVKYLEDKGYTMNEDGEWEIKEDEEDEQ